MIYHVDFFRGIDRNVISNVNLNLRMEEIRISNDDHECIIENYRILKLEKFVQGIFLRLE